MGVFSWLISWFRRPQPTLINYEEILTQLQTELREWEEKKAAAIASHRVAVMRLLFWACVLEVISIVWYYFLTSPTDMSDHLLCIAPVLLIPILGYIIKRTISWIYNTRICNADAKLIALENQQAEKVEELKKATNFYKTAQLVQQFDKKARTPAPAPRKPPPSQAVARKVPATPGPPASKRTAPAQQKPPATVGPAQRHVRPIASQPPPSSGPPPEEEEEATSDVGDAQSPEAPGAGLPVPMPGPRPVPPVRAPSQTPSSVPGRPAPRPTGPPMQTPSRSYYMPVPDRNNPVALPAGSAAAKPRGWLDSLLDVMIGDNEAHSVPVKCARCNALYGHVPRAEVDSYQFTCRKCRFWNDPLNSTSGPAPQPQASSRGKEKAEEEEQDDMPDLPMDDSERHLDHLSAEQQSGRTSGVDSEDEGEEHVLPDSDHIVTADDEDNQGEAGLGDTADKPKEE